MHKNMTTAKHALTNTHSEYTLMDNTYVHEMHVDSPKLAQTTCGVDT